MTKRVEYVEHPPREDLEAALVGFDEMTQRVLRGWHASLARVYREGYLPEDMGEEWSAFAGVDFFDTLPSWTVEVNGKPQTMADAVEQLNRVRAVMEKRGAF